MKFSENGNAIADYLTITDEAFVKIKELLSQKQEGKQDNETN